MADDPTSDPESQDDPNLDPVESESEAPPEGGEGESQMPEGLRVVRRRRNGEGQRTPVQ